MTHCRGKGDGKLMWTVNDGYAIHDGVEVGKTQNAKLHQKDGKPSFTTTSSTTTSPLCPCCLLHGSPLEIHMNAIMQTSGSAEHCGHALCNAT